jgi:hypothetical protein
MSAESLLGQVRSIFTRRPWRELSQEERDLRMERGRNRAGLALFGIAAVAPTIGVAAMFVDALIARKTGASIGYGLGTATTAGIAAAEMHFIRKGHKEEVARINTIYSSRPAIS